MKKRTIGIVHIAGDYIHNTPETVAKVFTKLQALPLRIDWRVDTDVYEYLLYSPLFRDVELGSKAPEYEIIVTCQLDDNIKVIDFDVEVREYLPIHEWLTRRQGSTTFDFLMQNLPQEVQP